MNEIQQIIEQFRLLTEQHLPAEMLPHVAWGGIVFLVVGAGLCVLGAKLARWGITCAFVGVGGFIGSQFAGIAGFPAVPCVAIGAAAVGIIAFMTYRLWVGVAAAVVLLGIALGVFGYDRIVPHVRSFEPAAVWSVGEEAAGDFTLLTPEQQDAYVNRTPGQWFRDLWTFVRERDADAPRLFQAVGLAATIMGLLIGVLAVRPTLILSTSLIGTFLVVSGLAALGQQFMPSVYQGGFNHPVVVGLMVGAFAISSIIVQTMLTRKTPSSRAEASAES
jgi:hypothetical protein